MSAAASKTKQQNEVSSSSHKPTRRQREGEETGEKQSHSTTANSKTNNTTNNSTNIICDYDLVKAVKTQMIPVQQYRSDVVDVRNNELGMKECHIVAALLGNSEKINGIRVVMPVNAKKKEGGEEQSQPQQPEFKKIPHFFERVHTMRLQLGSSILPSHRFQEFQQNLQQKTQQQKKKKSTNLNNLQCEGGFDVILDAIRQFHSPYLRRLDLSRNRFFTRHAEFKEAIALRQKEMSLFTSSIVSCKKLVILCLSHNVNLRSDGAVAVCRDVVAKLPSLRAVLMQRCSIDDTGAIGIAQLFAQGKLPAIPDKNSSSKNKDDDDEEDDQKNNKNFDDAFSTQSRSSYSVLLTLDLSENRIGPNGLIALRKAIPDCVGLGCEKQSPPMLKPKDQK